MPFCWLCCDLLYLYTVMAMLVGAQAEIVAWYRPGECGGGCDGEWRGDIGRQVRPIRGLTRSYGGVNGWILRQARDRKESSLAQGMRCRCRCFVGGQAFLWGATADCVRAARRLPWFLRCCVDRAPPARRIASKLAPTFVSGQLFLAQTRTSPWRSPRYRGGQTGRSRA